MEPCEVRHPVSSPLPQPHLHIIKKDKQFKHQELVSQCVTECASECDSIGLLEVLPMELIPQIISHLDWRGLLTASRVCTLFYYECNQERLWKGLFIRAVKELAPFEPRSPSPPASPTPFSHLHNTGLHATHSGMLSMTVSGNLVENSMTPPASPAVPSKLSGLTPRLSTHQENLLSVERPPEGKTWKWMLKCVVHVFSEGEVKNGEGTLTATNGDCYTGEWKDDKREGFGVFTNFFGDIYQGFFQANNRHGYGKFVAKSGSSYEGEWSTDLRHGKGKYRWTNGDVYEGEFKLHSRDGYGIYTWPSKDRYEGYFHQNAKHGHGSFYFSNGDKFEGQYVNGKRNGHGIYTWPHGDRFEGEYKDDMRNDWGSYQYSYGGKYEGHYQNDKRHGPGAFTWPDGDKFVGVWENESRRGKGILSCRKPDGSMEMHDMDWDEKDNANYAYSMPDKFPTAQNSRALRSFRS